MQTIFDRQKWSAITVLLSGALLGAPCIYAQNSLPQLWPRFSEPSNIVNVGLAGQSGNDFVAITSFQGAYNQQQLSTRLYVNTPADANYWLAHAVPPGITITNLPYNSSDPDGVLKALLATYGPGGTNTVTKYIVCDPVNIPESCNMATTMGGINDAMVINPDNLAVVSSYGLTEVADLRSYIWIGADQNLVGNNTINTVANPSGGSGTSGWSGSGTISTSTYNGQMSLEWQLPANQTGDHWITYKPAIPSSRINTSPYIFSFQVAGSGTVFMDVWNGCSDIQSAPVTLTPDFQVIQMPVQLVISGCTGNSTIQIQLRAHNQSTPITAYFNDAAAIGNRVAIDYYQYTNLASQTNGTILAQDFPTNGNLRDYIIAAKMFVFELTSDGAYKDEQALYGTIINSTPHLTPILGYIDHETEDVRFLSGQGYGHFLNASDDYNNGSVWASLPEPPSLYQPPPQPIQTTNGTVYVGLAMSDGDNASFVEHQDVGRWTANNFFGAVPMAWTTAPGMIDFAPGILSSFYQLLPQSQEMMPGPSGVGYTQAITGSDNTNFASLTNQFMTAESMSTVTDWASTTTDLQDYAAAINVPHVVWSNCLGYGTLGTLPTVLDGQCIGYNSKATTQVSAIESWLKSNYAGAGAPTFLEALNANTSAIPPDDVLYVAQQLQLNSGYNFVFLTPSELALTEEAYKSGTAGTLPTSNAQAVSGATLTSAFPQNVLWNAQGQSGNYSVTSTGWNLGSHGHGEFLFSTTYQGGGTNELVIPGNSLGVTVYAYEYLGSIPVPGRDYRFNFSVAGTGTAEITIYDGQANQHIATIPLTANYQTVNVILPIYSTSGQIQVGLLPSTSRQTLYFNAGSSHPLGWFYNSPSAGAGVDTAGGTTYSNGSFSTQSMYFSVPAGQTGDQWLSQHPGDGPVPSLLPNTSYTATVDVAGTPGAQALLDLSNGGTDATSSAVTLGQQWQTIATTYISSATPSNDQFEIRLPAGNSGNQTVYFRNATLVPTSSIGAIDFYTSLESGQPQLTWVNTIDAGEKGGGGSSVSNPTLQPSSTITRGGGSAIEYGGTASGAPATYAYMEAFSNSTTLSSTSRLSYWIYPMSPVGTEAGAGATTGLNSTCVALDLVFSDGKVLRDSGAMDQYGNQFRADHECNHLQPDQWNYVTVDLSGFAGKVINRIDVDYNKPGASGTYGGFIDDIKLSH